ncbi:MAG TPA: hypothetical protein VFW47_12335 [Phenylobacterium sp.]|nr:hypothetical protein [Phenylobacterium sp.]
MSERHDFYGPIHKGLRLGSTALLTRLGAVDWSDPAGVGNLLADLRAHLVLARKHLEHEDGEINVILRERAGDLGVRLDHDHEDHFATFDSLEVAIAAVEQAGDAGRRAAGHGLYLLYSRYLGEDLLHMAREEEEALPVFHALFDDSRLEAIHNRIKAQIPLDRLVAYFKLILAASSPQERVMLLADMRAGAPAEVYEAVESGAARTLPAKDWRALSRALNDLRQAA